MAETRHPTSARAGAGGRRPGGLDAQVWRVATAVILGAFVSIIDLTIVNVGLQTIGRELGSTSVSDIQWVVTAYMLAVAAVIPLTGWLSTRFGGRRVYIVSLVLFTVSSALCATAWSLGSLVAFRTLQGVAGGAIMPAGQMLLARAAGPQRMGRVMAVIGVPALMAPVLGPVLGGAILEWASWEWIFLVNVPVGAVALVLAFRLLPVDAGDAAERRARAGGVDWLGLAAVASGLPLIVYGLADIATNGADPAGVIGPIAAGIVLVAAFVIRSLRVSNPLVDIRLWKNRAFAAAATTSFFLGAGLFGSIILLPLYYQTVRGESLLVTGLLLAPQGLGAAAGITVSGRLTDRIGGGIVTLVGLSITAVTTIPFGLIAADTPYWWLSLALFARGIGFGWSMMPAMAAAYAALTRDDVEHATPQLNVLQRVGGSVGTAVLATVLQRGIEDALPAGALSGRAPEAGAAPPPAIAEALAGAYGDAFWWAIAIAALSIVPAFVLMRAERARRRGHAAAAAGAELGGAGA
jgi:EmrB/QacA subfamily drug resistance transporter